MYFLLKAQMMKMNKKKNIFLILKLKFTKEDLFYSQKYTFHNQILKYNAVIFFLQIIC